MKSILLAILRLVLSRVPTPGTLGIIVRNMMMPFALLVMVFAAPTIQAAVTCTISATSVAFNTYNPLSPSPTNSTGTLTATCSLTGNKNATVNLISSFSTGNSGTYSVRKMLSGTSVLQYNLYRDPAYTEIRGDGTGNSFTGSATLALTTSTRTQQATGTVYGQIPAGQDVAAGSYSDTIVVTITY